MIYYFIAILLLIVVANCIPRLFSKKNNLLGLKTKMNINIINVLKINFESEEKRESKLSPDEEP